MYALIEKGCHKHAPKNIIEKELPVLWYFCTMTRTILNTSCSCTKGRVQTGCVNRFKIKINITFRKILNLNLFSYIFIYHIIFTTFSKSIFLIFFIFMIYDMSPVLPLGHLCMHYCHSAQQVLTFSSYSSFYVYDRVFYLFLVRSKIHNSTLQQVSHRSQ